MYFVLIFKKKKSIFLTICVSIWGEDGVVLLSLLFYFFSFLHTNICECSCYVQWKSIVQAVTDSWKTLFKTCPTHKIQLLYKEKFIKIRRQNKNQYITKLQAVQIALTSYGISRVECGTADVMCCVCSVTSCPLCGSAHAPNIYYVAIYQLKTRPWKCHGN